MCADKINPESREDIFREIAQLHQDQLLGAIGKVAQSTEDMRAMAERVFSERVLITIKSSFRWLILTIGIAGPATGLFAWLWLSTHFVTLERHDGTVTQQVEFNKKSLAQFRSLELLTSSASVTSKEHERRLQGMEADIKALEQMLMKK